MTMKLVAISALAMGLAVPAFAENNVGQIGTEKEAKALIGAPLNASGSGGSVADSGHTETVFYLGGNTVKDSGKWTEADRKACTAAGGVEIPISAGRIACISL